MNAKHYDHRLFGTRSGHHQPDLLALIAIIAIVAALLLPILARAKFRIESNKLKQQISARLPPDLKTIGIVFLKEDRSVKEISPDGGAHRTTLRIIEIGRFSVKGPQFRDLEMQDVPASGATAESIDFRQLDGRLVLQSSKKNDKRRVLLIEEHILQTATNAPPLRKLIVIER